jgi:uncharacterized membrane protein
MTASRRRRLEPTRAILRLGISLLSGLAALAIATLLLPRLAAVLFAWDIGGLVLLGLSWQLIATYDARATRERAGSEDPGRTMVYVVIVLTSAISLVAATALLPNARSLPADLSHWLIALSLAAVSLAWGLTHTAFTFRYAHLFYREDAEGVGGATFPGDHAPTYFDFAYFAFTIGMCFQVSDVCVTSPQIRRTVLLHAVISFIYNSAILAFVLNLVFVRAG